jgi:hypothetical protein
MTMQGFTTFASPSLLGPSGYPAVALIPNGWNGPKDDAAVFTTSLTMGYVVPQEFMPRFGRQDIPFYQDNGPTFGTGRFLAGVNHLFTDGTDLTNPVFNVIGGEDNSTAGTLVTRFLAQTGATSGFLFGQYGTVHSVALINDRETGRLRGFGFIEFFFRSQRSAFLCPRFAAIIHSC